MRYLEANTITAVGRAAIVVSLSLSTGCGGTGSGSEGTDSAAETGATDGSNTDPGTDTQTGGTDTDGPPGACANIPASVGLQRLTRSEYNRTVADLFGVASSPADTFPVESVSGGFENDAASLTVSPQLASLMLDAAEAIAAEAVATNGAAIISCDPATDPNCARSIIEAQARRVFRRPPSSAETESLLSLVAFAEDEGDTFEQGIEYAIAGMLMAPQFLYRNVPPEGATPLGTGQLAALDDYALATRLSYLIWGSTPDDALLDQAAQGALGDPDVLRAEFDRMLVDPKASALFDAFLTRWLLLGRLNGASPDASVYPEFDEEIRGQMLEEVRLFFADLRQRDASIIELFTATESFANGPLAELYGVPGVSGASHVQVDLDPAQRAGVLTMPAVLTMNSDGDFPIVRRGSWVAEALLCSPPPPPPAEAGDAGPALPGETEREHLERHRQDPACYGCHALIDPIGFGFDNFDRVGRWRDDIDSVPVDNRGELPDGTTFDGVVELGGALAQSQAFATCVSTKFMTYAVGRAMAPDDGCEMERIGAETVTPDARFSDLMWAIVTSDVFTTQAGE